MSQRIDLSRTALSRTALDIIRPVMRRRQFVRAGVAGAASVAFGALLAREAKAGARHRGHSPDYGPLSPKQDLATGLPLLALPEGFEYFSYGWTGQLMEDGRPTPAAHDGMAVVARWGSVIALVRNHENSAGAVPPAIVDGGMYNPNEAGGTSNLWFDLRKGEFIKSYVSLGGTIRNCAGGLTPWGSWISCEETFHPWNSRADGVNHGYIFEVPGFGIGSGRPVRAAGRFSHEAVAVDPSTGIVYETEDTGSSGFYKYVPPGCGRGQRAGLEGWRGHELRDGGELYALVADGERRKDLRGGFAAGTRFSVSWQRVTDPEGQLGTVYDSAPDAAIISRGEGAWYDSGKIYFASTSGGAAGMGQIWVYDPEAETLTVLFESPSSDVLDGPDNIAVSPRGGIVMCEDGGSDPKRLIGLSPDGIAFEFAQNRVELAPGDLDVIDAVYPGTKANFPHAAAGTYSGMEWAGATFYGDWLFVNVQTPGVTFAIRGPWRRGAL